ncbi:MAG: hypothetical protein ABUL53_10515 [Bradyrhizobium guangdongense]
MEQGVEAMLALRIASQHHACLSRDTAGCVHLTGIGELLDGIKQQADDLFMGRRQRMQRGIVKPGA